MAKFRVKLNKHILVVFQFNFFFKYFSDRLTGAPAARAWTRTGNCSYFFINSKNWFLVIMKTVVTMMIITVVVLMNYL